MHDGGHEAPGHARLEGSVVAPSAEPKHRIQRGALGSMVPVHVGREGWGLARVWPGCKRDDGNDNGINNDGIDIDNDNKSESAAVSSPPAHMHP